ncbi:MAG: zinc ribbon domain-containing protein [Lachnospiraceae bacterium]|nr:zinc ribbon domain-containing protein [Lachnospiraceae bacterium]
MAVCNKCGEMNKDGIAYCAYCGAKLPQVEKKKVQDNKKVHYCPACGEKNPGGITNCKYCGATLDDYLYNSRIEAASKKSIGEQLDRKKMLLFVLITIVSYVICFGLIAVFPPISVVAIILGWKWTGTNVSYFVDLSNDFAVGVLIGKVIVSFFVGV